MKKIHKIQNQKVTDVKRLNNSVNGNPRYKFVFESGTPYELVAFTPSDAGWVYSFSQHTFLDQWVDISYHVTPSRVNFLDSITLNKQEEK